MRITAVLTQRNEGAFLLEWLAHHRVVGVSGFVVLSNDCDDGSDAMLDRLEELGLLTHLRNPPPYNRSGIQFSGLKRADRAEAVRQADWLLALDIDEFVNVHVGRGTLPELIAALPEADAITLTWRLFGNAGVTRFRDAPVTGQFLQAAPAVMYWPWRASMFKTLYRNDGRWGKLGVHRPRNPAPGGADAARWFDAAGRALGPEFRRGRLFSDYGRDNYALAQLNHYPLGAMESYILKSDRGRAVHADQPLGMDYWVERNFCACEDRSIQRHGAATRAEIARLKQDAKIAALHAAAVDWRRARFDALMQSEANRALYGRLLMCPPTRPLSADEAAPLQAHGIRARDRDA